MLDQTELWDHMHDQHGLFLLQGEMDSIINIVIQKLRKKHPDFPAATSLLAAQSVNEPTKPNTYTELLTKHATVLAKHATKMAGPGTVNIRDRAGLLPHIRPDGNGGYEVDHVAIFLTTQEFNKRVTAQITNK